VKSCAPRNPDVSTKTEEEVAMNRILVLLAFIIMGMTGTVDPSRASEAAAVFPMSLVESIDVRNQLLTFKSHDGRLWLMRVADPAAMKRESLTKGDVVSIEVGLDDQILRIEKIAPSSEAARRKSGSK
jgi:hypothetical protein